ncbi:MAG: hypothetical protein CXZ00_10595 [Acidobacteria bacterium]|nr:MAG: hypothetical protein CXZ00_10595 [Acidobacteriota bacterium]
MTELTTIRERGSYAVGVGIGGNLQKGGIEFDPEIFLRGLMDVLSGNKLLISGEELRVALAALKEETTKKKEAEHKALGDENKKQGDAFLAANKIKEGIITLPNGLQYKIIKQGTGPKPVISDNIQCNYRGTLIDGTEFDSSDKQGEPGIFSVNRVIEGWAEILRLMPVGSKYEVFVPANLAYGENSPIPAIGPNSTLIFDIELLSILDEQILDQQTRDQQ